MTSEESSPTAALLVVGKSAVFKFNQKEITIGRSNDNNLVIESNKVSRKHARINYRDGVFFIEDLNSTGGTYLNGQKIDKRVIDEGDVITLANVHLVFGRNVSVLLTKANFQIQLQAMDHIMVGLMTRLPSM